MEDRDKGSEVVEPIGKSLQEESHMLEDTPNCYVDKCHGYLSSFGGREQNGSFDWLRLGRYAD